MTDVPKLPEYQFDPAGNEEFQKRLSKTAKLIERLGGKVFKVSAEMINADDSRPAPKPRKHIELWQAYQTWDEFVQLRKGHNTRLISILRGKSAMRPDFEVGVIQTLTVYIELHKIEMIRMGELAGPIWDWLTGIRGLGDGSMAAQLVSLLDDPAKFDSVAALWRHSLGGVVEFSNGNGRAYGRMERSTKGEKSPVNKDMAALCYNIADQFVRQQTPRYADNYYAEKERLVRLHPEPVPAAKGVNVPKGYPWPMLFTPKHIDRMAKRKMVKGFLRDLWLNWRTFEGLAISEKFSERESRPESI